jgi:large subunit ribosomal protein L32
VAVPKRRKSSSKRDMRRANHDKITVPNLIACPNCKEPCAQHRVCPACGFYKGAKVKDTGKAST